MSPPTTATDRVPRGLPQEQPVEVVAVSSHVGRWALVLLAAVVLELALVVYFLATSPPYVLVR